MNEESNARSNWGDFGSKLPETDRAETNNDMIPEDIAFEAETTGYGRSIILTLIFRIIGVCLAGLVTMEVSMLLADQYEALSPGMGYLRSTAVIFLVYLAMMLVVFFGRDSSR